MPKTSSARFAKVGSKLWRKSLAEFEYSATRYTKVEIGCVCNVLCAKMSSVSPAYYSVLLCDTIGKTSDSKARKTSPNILENSAVSLGSHMRSKSRLPELRTCLLDM